GLRAREAGLLAAHAGAWLGGLGVEPEGWRCERGLLWLKLTPRAVRQLPDVPARRGARAWGAGGMGYEQGNAVPLPPLLPPPLLAHLSGLVLFDTGIGPDAAALAGSPHVASLTRLVLPYNGIGDEGALALARSPSLARLRELNLDSNGITERGARALLASFPR